jgi:exodeoxyribonuclease V gamma subunit
MISSNGINLYFSHSVEQLACKLGQNITEQQAQQGVFADVSVLVPNGNMQRFLQLHIAQQQGVCAQVDFPFLETGLFHWVKSIAQIDESHLNGTLLAWQVWQLLKSEDIKDNPVYQLVEKYLSLTTSKRQLAIKQFQLSQKLAMLLLDYESQRPEMIEAWLSGTLYFGQSKDDHLIELEKLQMDLYQRLIKGSEKKNITLFQAARQLSQVNTEKSSQEIHLFTPSRISQLHRQIFVQLSQFITVNVYQLNVCMEYWEDMQTNAELQWQQRKLDAVARNKINFTDQEGMPAKDSSTREIFAELQAFPDENSLLRAWGKPGREALKLFSEVENDAAHLAVFFNDIEAPDSLLSTIQYDILNRQTQTKKLCHLSQLQSLQIATAPSIYREVQAVYNSILWNLKQNESLMLNDIAVLVTDMHRYRFVIEQVFEELNHQHQASLSYAIVDSSAAIESRYAEAVLDLFTVMEDDFIRASVFKWLDNPCVKAGNQFDDQDWHDWLMAVDYLGIYAGFKQLYPNQDASAEMNLSELFTWEQGLQRLHLSLAVIDEESEDLRFLDATRLGQFSVLINTIYQFKNSLRKPLTAIQWQHRLNRMFELLLSIPANDNKEQYVQLALQQSLLKLATQQADLVLTFDDIQQFIRHELQQIPATKGNYLSGGVVCAALQPMRPIPFKITYVLGMDESTFPGPLTKETLDLTHRSRRIGDINGVENKNYLFLETLMCTREKLYLSYVGQDLQKGETIEPSPVLQTLQAYCDELIDYSELPLNSFPVIQLPLDASDGFDQTISEYSDWGVNFSYADQLLYCDKYQADDWPKPLNDKQAQQLELLEKTLSLESSQNIRIQEHSKNKSDVEVIEINADELAEFITNPQAAVLKQQGVVSKHPEDLSLVQTEPQDISGLLKHQVFTGAVIRWLQNPQTANFHDLLNQQYQQHLKTSKAPVELFANMEKLTEVTKDLHEKIRPQLEQHKYMGGLRLGNCRVEETPGMSFTAIEFELDTGQKVLVNGLAENLFVDEQCLSNQVIISSASNVKEWNAKLNKPFIHWCLWQLSDQIKTSEPFRVHLIFPAKAFTIELKPWTASDISFSTQSTIKAYIKSLLEDYLAHQSLFLPHELLDQLKIPRKADVSQQVPLLKAKSKAKQINFLAYEVNQLNKGDLNSIHEKYQKNLQWPSYDEIFQLVDCDAVEQPEKAYRKYLLPLYAMVFGQFEGSSGGQS